ncbi:MAG: cation-translocating P-type ATPase [Syntrophales bacterium]|nr:cation-translocating P-type ATPase [Syntrophales bacterium]
MTYHQQTAEKTIDKLGTSLKGLSAEEAGRRLAKYGPNELQEKKKKTALAMFLGQFTDFMILVLMAAAIISGFIGEPADTIAIIVIVVLNAIIGFVQEYRAERAMAALKKMAAPSATVRRDGGAREVPAAEVVPGDVVVLEAGKIVPADMRLIETANLRTEEASLTGESVPVEKHTEPLAEERLPVGDRKNMAYKSTVVAYGRGKGVIIATGMETEIGKIAVLLQEEEEVKTPLQKRLARFGKKLAIAILVICGVVFAAGLLRGEPVLLMLLTAISLAVAAIPEALPAVVTISLALGARKMVKHNALMRKLPAVETLGSVTYICSDKTGTLTQNRMTVEKVYINGRILGAGGIGDAAGRIAPGNADLPSLALTALALSNDVSINEEGNPLGDPTEIAFFRLAKDYGLLNDEIKEQFPRVDEIPFDSERKCMTTFHKWPDGKYVSFTKGAVEAIVDKAWTILTDHGSKEPDKEEILKVNEEMAAQGLRVLGIAMRKWEKIPAAPAPENSEQELELIGLIGLIDPPREEVAAAVASCMEAGIRPVMITGDHPLTAAAIAERLGIAPDDSQAVVSGRELEDMTREEFEKRVENIRVYARVAPEQKLKIVKALQEKGQFVAMTGDGVNDAPALKRADIGIAMGITGTDVSKEAAHMILLDDNFATIVRAVREGRKIYDNIRKFIKYLLTTNSGEIWTLFLAPLIGLPVPLLPIHILWVNLMTDALPALALSLEPEEGNVMKRPPRHPRESIFAYGLGIHAIWVGLLMGIVVLSVQGWSIGSGNSHWQTLVFTVLCLTQLGHVLAIRSERESLFTIGLLSNKPLLGAVLLSFLFQMATLYVPFLNPIFHTEPLAPTDLAMAIVLSSVIFVAVEIEKLIKRKRDRKP